jgi:D-alanine-D-alanine ligase
MESAQAVYMKKMKIAVLFGGFSEEREVSIASAAKIIPVLRQRGHDVFSVDAAAGRLSLADEHRLLETGVAPEPPVLHEITNAHSTGFAVNTFDIRGADVVLIALHGGAGEDGRIQALLDLAGVAYTGSNHIASALAMDKDLSKRLFRSVGVPTADWLMSPASRDQIEEQLGWPVVVKPNKQGSTIGLTVVRSATELDDALQKAHRYDDEVMIEKFISGREFTVGILDGQALPVGEIVVSTDVFDYQSKYQTGGAREIFPAQISQEQAKLLQEFALRVHCALKLSTYSRIDFRLDGNGLPYCLEANSLPGMTATSLLPQAASAAGIEFPELLDRICQGGLKSSRKRT